MPVGVNFVVYDGKEARSLVKFNFADGFSFADYTEASQALLPLLKGMITGAVVSAGLCLDLALTGFDSRGDAAGNSDVEEGGRFVWDAGIYNTANRIPTFDETFIITNSRNIDQTAVPVSNFINAVQNGINTAGGNINITDYRGVDIDKVSTAKESFQRSRR